MMHYHGFPINKFESVLCKVLINSSDERAAAEIYAAESLTRYISGMFYGLVFSSISIFMMLLFLSILHQQVISGLVILLIAYLYAILEIIRRFRNIRIKEVEMVFAASFKNRDLFEQRTPAIFE